MIYAILPAREYAALFGPWGLTPWYLRLMGKPRFRRCVTFYLGKREVHSTFDWANSALELEK